MAVAVAVALVLVVAVASVCQYLIIVITTTVHHLITYVHKSKKRKRRWKNNKKKTKWLCSCKMAWKNHHCIIANEAEDHSVCMCSLVYWCVVSSATVILSLIIIFKMLQASPCMNLWICIFFSRILGRIPIQIVTRNSKKENDFIRCVVLWWIASVCLRTIIKIFKFYLRIVYCVFVIVILWHHFHRLKMASNFNNFFKCCKLTFALPGNCIAIGNISIHFGCQITREFVSLRWLDYNELENSNNNMLYGGIEACQPPFIQTFGFV